MQFQIKDEFYIDGKKTKLISGSVHYFRITPDHWEDSLYNLKAMGCNAVETYIPWNMHEPQRGKFNFSGMADVEHFIRLAQQMDLYIILRPTPYICAEWEFGGFPAWLLQDRNLRVRSQDPKFMEAVDEYFAELIPRLTPFQFTRGGNVLMMQIENEYGSYSNDKTYLRKLRAMMEKYGVDVPFFTSDGGWEQVLDAGTLTEDGVLATANFGSNAESNFNALAKHFSEHNVKRPFMCMEFWDGWFNNWGKEIIRRSPEETAHEVQEILKRGSINFYMFHGGTNFGFYNGSSDEGKVNNPQITSYDYDAPLTEWGAPTEKFYAVQKAIAETVPEAITFPPRIPKQGAYETCDLTESVSLFNTLDTISTPVENDYTLTMEQVGQELGYILYETSLDRKRTIKNLHVVEADDRLQFFLNEEKFATQFLEEVGEDIEVTLPKDHNKLSVLVENFARNNYGPKLVAYSQYKGIRSGIREDIHYLSGFNHYPLPLDNIEKVDYTRGTQAGNPSFYRGKFQVEELVDTFIDTRNLGKGVMYVNGVNIGRYWEKGPFAYLFAPAYFFKKGENEIVIFETEGTPIEKVHFSKEPIFIDVQKAD